MLVDTQVLIHFGTKGAVVCSTSDTGCLSFENNGSVCLPQESDAQKSQCTTDHCEHPKHPTPALGSNEEAAYDWTDDRPKQWGQGINSERGATLFLGNDVRKSPPA